MKQPQKAAEGLFGAHVSVAGGLDKAFDRGTSLGCRVIQIFVKNANRWTARPLLDLEVEEFRGAHAKSAIGTVLAHASYLINLCSVDKATGKRSVEALGDELDRCQRLGVDALVLHPGAHRGQGSKLGVKYVARGLDEALARRPGLTKVLLENTAGQGTYLGARLEELAEIRSAVKEPCRVGICLDTCHAFAAGYGLHQEAGYEEFTALVRELFPPPALAALHLNDSLAAFGSRRDRHANLGEGEIGRAAFARIVRDPLFAGLPLILETPQGAAQSGYRSDLGLLRQLLRGNAWET